MFLLYNHWVSCSETGKEQLGPRREGLWFSILEDSPSPGTGPDPCTDEEQLTLSTRCGRVENPDLPSSAVLNTNGPLCWGVLLPGSPAASVQQP